MLVTLRLGHREAPPASSWELLGWQMTHAQDAHLCWERVRERTTACHPLKPPTCLSMEVTHAVAAVLAGQLGVQVDAELAHSLQPVLQLEMEARLVL